MPREESKAAALLGAIGGFVLILSIPLALLLLGGLYGITTDELLDYIFSARDAMATLIFMGIMVNAIIGVVSVIAGVALSRDLNRSSKLGFSILLVILGIVGIIISIAIIGGFIGASGGGLALVGGLKGFRDNSLPGGPRRSDIFECERCGGVVPANAKKCAWCGLEFVDDSG